MVESDPAIKNATGAETIRFPSPLNHVQATPEIHPGKKWLISFLAYLNNKSNKIIKNYSKSKIL